MWQTISSRREFVEMILNIEQPISLSAKQRTDFLRYPSSKQELLLCWAEDPSMKSSLPVLAVLPDAHLDEIFAVIGSNPGAPSPFTAHCRMITSDRCEGIFRLTVFKRASWNF